MNSLRRSLSAVIVAIGLAAGLMLGLSGCENQPPEKWGLYDIQGHLPDLSFTLAAAHGKTFTQNDLRGKTVLMFFGYASCPDICPTTMAQLTEVLRTLGKDARDVRIVFVSVDPHRDTPDLLQQYVDAFNRNAIGLTGNVDEIADLARRYRVAYQIEKPKPGQDADHYDVTHGRGIYIFDNQGRARLLAADSGSTAVLVKDIRQLVRITQATASHTTGGGTT